MFKSNLTFVARFGEGHIEADEVQNFIKSGIEVENTIPLLKAFKYYQFNKTYYD